MQSKKINFIIIGAAIFSFLLLVSAAKTKSLTYDEPTFIASGYSYLDHKEIKLNPEAPPFLQALVAFPLKFLNLKSPDYSHSNYAAERQIAFAQMFLEHNRDKLGDITFLSRMPVHLLFFMLVIMVGFFVKTQAGALPAIAASALVALSPNLIAHGQLATTDFGCAVFMFISVYTFYLAIRSNGYKRWLICGLVTGLALLSKFTALLLAPIFFTFVLYEILLNDRNKTEVFRGLLLLVFIILLVICVGYGFKPWLYLYGISKIYNVGKIDYQQYLFGNVFSEPVWYYYFAAFLVKTPVSTLLLIIFSVYETLRLRPDRDTVVYFLTPVGITMFVCCFDLTNLGLRRILPVYPFLLSYVSIVYFYSKPNRLKTIIFAALLTSNIIVTLIAYPHYISYFNIPAGGAINGPNLLDDSNIDWGQDLLALAEWQKYNSPEEPINLMYFGSMNPELYGLYFRPMPRHELIKPSKGIYAISTHYLIYTRKLAYWNNKHIDWLKLYEPIDYVGNSIYIYQFSHKPDD
tara:strand:- start:146 stop:1702 length:1557 start_codon:yes stop_codon:yes gene_type:complete